MDYDVTEIVSELIKLLPLTENPGLIIVKAKAADIYALQRDSTFIKEFSGFRVNVPRTDCLTIDTSMLNISTLSKEELDMMNFDEDPDEITPETFRLLVRRLAFGKDAEKTKKALAGAFRSGRLSEEEIANILHATWIDMSRLDEIFALIEH